MAGTRARNSVVARDAGRAAHESQVGLMNEGASKKPLLAFTNCSAGGTFLVPRKSVAICRPWPRGA
jgi:hypothetical protein